MAYYIGLISGTSMDAIDAALVAIEDPVVRLIAYQETPYTAETCALLQRIIIAQEPLSADDFGRLHVCLGQEFANAALRLLSQQDILSSAIRAIGSHGQTVIHRPNATPGFTWQLGDPSVIAFRTGITTVADFRAMDVAAGGQGAPLVPPFHSAIFGHPGRNIAVVNLGGIANVTLLSAEQSSVIAFDCGPANTLLDTWISNHQGLAFDAGGAWAAKGSVIPALLKIFLRDAYFAQKPPKSTGREYFNLAWINAALEGLPVSPIADDVQRTLLQLTAETVVDAVIATMPGVEQILLCGGGARNSLLKSEIQSLARCPVQTTDELGYPANAIEAMAFAWLAERRLNCQTGNLTSVTGASREMLLGGIYSI